MATDEEKVLVKFEAEVKRLQTDLNKAEKKVSRFERQAEKSARRVEKSFKDMGRGLNTVLGALALGAVTRSIVQATQKQEMAIAQLRQGYESTAGGVGQSVDDMIRKAGELQNVTIFGDEQFIEAQSQLITFTNIVGKEFDKTIELAADLSVRMGQDLKSSVLQLGKALNDPVANLGALSRSGIQFSKDQKEVIKQLAETGRLADAQKIILGELERQFGGSAKAARDTFGGALTSVQNAFGDLLESKTGLNGAKDSLEEFTRLLQDPRTVAAADKLTSTLITGFVKVAEAITDALNLTKFLAEEASRTFNGVASDDIAGLEREADKIRELMKTSLTSTERFRFFGPGGVVEFYDDGELEAELAKIEAAIAEARSRQEQPFIVAGQENFSAQPANAGVTPKDTGTSIAIPPEINKQYERMLANLREQVALFEQTSKAAEVRYKIESGALGELTEAQQQKLIAQAEELDQLNQLSELSTEVESLRLESLDKEAKAVEELQGKYMKLMEAVQAGELDPEEANKIAAGLAERFEEQQQDLKDTGNEFSEFAAEAARGMQSAFADFLFDPFAEGLDGMGKRFGELIQRMIAEAMAAKALTALFGENFTQTGQLGGIVGAFAGGFASGGTMPSNSWGIVGENGPELARTGSQPMHIIPNHELKGSGGVSITQNISGIEKSEDLKRTAQQVARQTARAIREAGG